MGKVESEAEAIYDKLGRGAQTDVKTIAAAIIAAENRGREGIRGALIAAHDILRADDRYGALAHLPAGGVECEQMVEQAVDLIAAALSEDKDQG